MCRRQYLRSFLLTHVCESDFPTTLVEFFSRFPGLRRFIGTYIVRFSTAVDAADLQHALSPSQAVIQDFGQDDPSSSSDQTDTQDGEWCEDHIRRTFDFM